MIIFVWIYMAVITAFGLWALWELIFWGRMGKLPWQERQRDKFERLSDAMLITACGCKRDYDGIPYGAMEWRIALRYPQDWSKPGDWHLSTLGIRTFRYEGRDDRGVRIFREDSQ
jgi:hypothetical protein